MILVLDQLGIPTKVGDIVLFGMSNDDTFSGVKQCMYYECEIIEIADWQNAFGNYNRELTVMRNKHCMQTTMELTKELENKVPRKYTNSTKQAEELLKIKPTKMKIMSNDVLNLGKIKDIAQTQYAQFFI